MKIEKSDLSQSLLFGQSKKIGDKKPGVGFDDVLKQQISASSVTSGMEPSQWQSVKGLSKVAPVAGSAEPVQTVERVLNTVARYGQMLDDPRATLRTIEPTVRHMKEQAASLDRLLQSLPTTNPVAKVLEETRVLIGQEIERFDAGYYLDP